MRLDKYLKVSRLIKRRTVANEACDNARVTVNGRPAKASYDVKVGDRLEIQFGAKTVCVEVLQVADNVRKDDAAGFAQTLRQIFLRQFPEHRRLCDGAGGLTDVATVVLHSQLAGFTHPNHSVKPHGNARRFAPLVGGSGRGQRGHRCHG